MIGDECCGKNKTWKVVKNAGSWGASLFIEPLSKHMAKRSWESAA